MDENKLKSMRGASYLLPDPGGEVVRECIDEIERLNAKIARLRDTLLFVRDECDWYTPFGDFGGGGDERIGPAITAALYWPNEAVDQRRAEAEGYRAALKAAEEDTTNDT